MANIKRGPAEQNPRDYVVIMKIGDQIHKLLDTNKSNNVTCVPKSELWVGGPGSASLFTCIVIHMGHSEKVLAPSSGSERKTDTLLLSA